MASLSDAVEEVDQLGTSAAPSCTTPPAPMRKQTLQERWGTGPPFLFRQFLVFVWSTVTWLGSRRVWRLFPRLNRAYADTVFWFPSDAAGPHVCLTIDDGIARGGADQSMSCEVRALLQRHNALATFFVCSEYLIAADAADLVSDGHELANHLCEDRQGYYAHLPPADFDAELGRASAAIARVPGAAAPLWFRAPQGHLTGPMLQAVRARGMRHALGDTYCDDWALSCSEHGAKTAARLLLRQVRPGSVVMLHMPERGFRRQCVALVSNLRSLLPNSQPCSSPLWRSSQHSLSQPRLAAWQLPGLDAPRTRGAGR